MNAGVQQSSIDDALARGLEPRGDDLDDARLREVVAEVADFYRRIRADDSSLPDPYQAGGEWGVYVENRRSFYDALLNDDIDTATTALRSFWRGDLGPIVSQYAYYPDLAAGDEAKVSRFTEMLARDYAYWQSMLRLDPAELEVPVVGEPWGLVLDDVLVTPLAMRFHLHCRQIAELLRDQPADERLVAEIGGGYGGMAHRLSIADPGITYVDFDLPETLVIAAFYLRCVMPERDVHLWSPGDTLDREALLSHDVVLAPHYAIQELGDLSVDLFVNAFSLSEMRREAVEEYMRRIGAAGRRYFLQNNVDRLGVVNRGYERIPCSQFPLDPQVFKTLYFKFDQFQGPAGDYRESLHERID